MATDKAMSRAANDGEGGGVGDVVDDVAGAMFDVVDVVDDVVVTFPKHRSKK